MMTLVTRNTLKPGQMFIVPRGKCKGASGLNDVYIVIDRKTEVGFWWGGRYVFGDVAPAWLVHVVA